MTSFNLLAQQNGNYTVNGELTFQSLNKKTIKSFDFLNSKETICIDLDNVSSADSAGLALIIEWIKYSQLHGTKLLFKNIPQQILTLARLGNFNLDAYLS